MKKEMNNKGFSLVELIIVIAIMVILVAVLAPQYLKYVEKSRVSTDVQTTVEFINALQVLASDPDVDLSGGTYTVENNASDTIKLSSDLKDALIDSGMMASADFSGTNSTSKYQSTGYKGATIKLELVYDSTAKIWHVETTGVDTAGKLP